MVSIIERNNWFRDLDVLVDEKLKFETQLQEAIFKTRGKIGWVTRTFKNRSIKFL